MVGELRLLEDPLIEEVSSLAAIAMKGEDLAYTPTIPLHHRPQKQDLAVSPMIDHHFTEAPILQITVC
jgi:hypothetical protein